MPPRKKAVNKVECRCDELEARLAKLEAQPAVQSVDAGLVSRLQNAVNSLLRLQANGKRSNIRKV